MLTTVLTGVLLVLLWQIVRQPVPRDPRRGRAALNWAGLFGLIATISVGTVAIATPPFQVSDEIAHFYRADLVARDGIVGTRRGQKSGGTVDHAIFGIVSPFFPLILHPDNKVTSTDERQAASVAWDGQVAYAKFENTSIYPPFLYAASGSAILFGRLVGLPVVTTFYLARLTTGLLAVGFGCAALRLAGPAAPWLFTMLLLPMSLAQMASVSQDALAIPLSAAGAALALNLSGTDQHGGRAYILFLVVLALVATARIAYLPLALMPLTLRRVGLRRRIAGATAIAGSVVIWSLVANRFALVPFGLPGVDAAAQFSRLLASPTLILSVAGETVSVQSDLYAKSFIGVLGWLDAPLPYWYYILALCIVCAQLPILLLHRIDIRQLDMSVARLLSLAASVVAIFVALYLSWSPVGDRIVEGVQGRYLLPLAMFIPVLVPFEEHPAQPPEAGIGHGLRSMLIPITAAFPLVSVPVVIMAVIGRYYLS